MAKTIVTTNVATPRLLEDIPDLNKEAIMSAIMNNRSISNSLLMASLQGPVPKLKKLEEFSKKASYYYAPATVFSSLDQPLTDEEVWLQYINGTDTYVDEVDHTHFYTVYLATTGEIGSKGYAPIIGTYALQNDPILAPDTFSRLVFLSDSVEVRKFNDAEPPVESVHLTVPTPVLTDTVYYVGYIRWVQPPTPADEPTPDPIATVLVDIYNESDGYIPRLHPIIETPLAEEIYPFIPLRINGVDYADDGTGLDGSDSIEDILNIIDLNPDDIVEGIKSNADEADIDDVYLSFGISITSEEEWAIIGLTEIFAQLNNSIPDTKIDFDTGGTRQAITIRADSRGGFNNTLSYNYIDSQIKTGTPGYTKAFIEGGPLEECFTEERDDGEGGKYFYTYCEVIGSTNKYIFTRPISNTNTYEEITVSGFTSKHTIAVPGFTPRVVQFTGNEEELVVPMFQTAFNNIPRKYQADVVFGSMSLFVYAINKTKLKWYQSGIFKAFLFILTIVLAVFTYGASLASAAGIGLLAVLSVIGTIILSGIALDYAVQWLVEEVGGTLALILSVAVALYTGDLSTLSTQLNSGWYSVLSSVTKVYSSYTKAELNILQESYGEFEEEYEVRLTELEEARELLHKYIPLDIEDLVNDVRSIPNTSPQETPQSFYDRTSTTIDLPKVSTSLVDDYYKLQSMLPVIDSYSSKQDFNGG